jgi:hypothetical protein
LTAIEENGFRVVEERSVGADGREMVLSLIVEGDGSALTADHAATLKAFFAGDGGQNHDGN